jgi:hypothetical protein
MDAGVFASLVEDQHVIPRLVEAIERAVDRSFDGRHGLIIVPGSRTRAEEMRRINICLDVFKVLRGDMKWSWQRAIDHVPQYLQKVLDGDDWEPEARAAWAPPSK